MIEFAYMGHTYLTRTDVYMATVSREVFQEFDAGEHPIDDVDYSLSVEAHVQGSWSCPRGVCCTLEEEEQEMIDRAHTANLVHELSYTVRAHCRTPEAAVMLKLKFS